MIIVDRSESSIYCDVDGTLLHHVDKGSPGAFPIECPYTRELMYVIPDEAHIRLLKRNSVIGKSVLVWSHGGIKWAVAAIRALKLEQYVTAIVPKLEVYIDDNEFSQDGMQLIRVYMPNGWGKSLRRE